MSHAHRITAATALHQGGRAYQQDQVALLQHPRAKGCLLGVVADGLGGRSGGRKAAEQVVLTARQLFERFDPATDSAAGLLSRLVDEAHLVIRLTAVSSEQEPHSTVAAFVLLPGGACHWIHAGDSRLYHFHAGRLCHRSLDHSYVQGLVDQGVLSEQEANDHPESNVLLSCLGGSEPPEVGTHAIETLQPGDALLVCSDGLWHYFSPQELGEMVQAVPAREAAEWLVETARARGGEGADNLSLVLVRVDPLPSASAPAPATPGAGL